MPCAPVLTRNEMIMHPQVTAGGIVIENEHEHAGPVRQARNAALFSRTPADVRRGAPALGGHSLEILRSLGLSDAEIGILENENVLMAGDG